MIRLYTLFVVHAEFTPRIVADAFYTGELEAELRHLGRVDFQER